MANFSTPFGNDDPERRVPTADERANGFACGPADKGLFNGMFHRVESEVGAVIGAAGLTPTDSDYTQLLQAINALIDAATGGGDTSQFLLLSQAAARLPIFPEFLTGDGAINVSSPATGTVRLPGGIDFLHRGISPVTTIETDFPTSASRIYHVRWSTAEGFTMKDVAGDAAYNPLALDEDDEAFDSTYDDMLIARVITNSGNVASITNLRNLNRLNFADFNDGPMTSNVGVNAAYRDVFFTYNLARRPLLTWTVSTLNYAPNGFASSFASNPDHDHDQFISEFVNNRYRLQLGITRDMMDNVAIRLTGVL